MTSGAGAAALACLNLLLKVGLKRENVYVTDLAGVVYQGRIELMDEDKAQYAQKTSARTLSEVIEGADVFLGLSAGGVLKPKMVATMAANPVIFALANPNPEITPENARSVRDDIIMATGDVRTTRTRSTTSCAFPTSSVAPSMSARPRSPTRWKLRPCTPSPNWPRLSRANASPRPTRARSSASGASTSSPSPLIRA